MKKRICILGSTGSVGKNTLRVIAHLKDRFRVCGLSAQSNAELLAEQAGIFKPRAVAIGDEEKGRWLRERITRNIRVLMGQKGIEELAGQKEADTVVIAISGNASIRPTYKAVSSGKDVALASKESLVSAGHLIMREARRRKSRIIPVDSEHSAVFQCLSAGDISQVRNLYITASGGPLWKVPKSSFRGLSRKAVLKHPKWKMGRKISVDSATMMNKGLEMIEAMWLFGIDIDRIKILIHPEAIVHSLVEFVDGSVLAQLGITDMRLPIQCALSYPDRYGSGLRPLDLVRVKDLTFHRPDRGKFPSLRLAREAAQAGGSAPCALNSANEAAVNAFLRGRIRFSDIPVIIEKILSKHRHIGFPSLEQIEDIGQGAQREVAEFCLSRS